ncbi:hypothetical protein C7A07_26515, partial [Pseudomonas fragi]
RQLNFLLRRPLTNRPTSGRGSTLLPHIDMPRLICCRGALVATSTLADPIFDVYTLFNPNFV